MRTIQCALSDIAGLQSVYAELLFTTLNASEGAKPEAIDSGEKY
jgi:hypothetical protein